jgi:DNA uptake protein ComE-like DNA-binding protein
MNYKQYFLFNKDQRTGLTILVLLIVILQLLYFFIDFSAPETTTIKESEWLALQTEIDSLKEIAPDDTYKIYPYNPNFITDFKGYKLGMKVAEIDRLLAYRKLNKYVNSAQEFQNITKISDSLLAAMSPYFKFPDWVNNKNKANSYSSTNFETFTKQEKIVVKDLNLASKDDLMKIYGIGDAISDRILKQKELLGAFVSIDQIDDIWGLSPEVVKQLKLRFKVSGATVVKKIDINNLPIRELIKFPYFKYTIAKEIVTFRSMNNGINGPDDLTKIKDFPIDKLKIIILYLDFK